MWLAADTSSRCWRFDAVVEPPRFRRRARRERLKLKKHTLLFGMVTPRWAPPRLGTTELQVRIGDGRNAAAAEGVGAGLCAVRRLRSVTVCNVVPATSTCCLGTQWTPLADCGEGSSVAEPECQKDPSAWLCKQRIVHLRPNSASASPSGVGRERLKRCLTFWTACSLQQASPSRDLHACQCSQLQSPRRLPEIGSLAPLLAGGGPAYPGCPSAVSHWQGMLLSLCTFRYAYHFITTGMWRPKNFVLAKGGRHFQMLLLPAVTSASAS